MYELDSRNFIEAAAECFLLDSHHVTVRHVWGATDLKMNEENDL
jgi:hypothetical protein